MQSGRFRSRLPGLLRKIGLPFMNNVPMLETKNVFMPCTHAFIY